MRLDERRLDLKVEKIPYWTRKQELVTFKDATFCPKNKAEDGYLLMFFNIMKIQILGEKYE